MLLSTMTETTWTGPQILVESCPAADLLVSDRHDIGTRCRPAQRQAQPGDDDFIQPRGLDPAFAGDLRDGVGGE